MLAGIILSLLLAPPFIITGVVGAITVEAFFPGFFKDVRRKLRWA